MRPRVATIIRRCTAWAVCLTALGAVTTVALRTVDTGMPGAFPDGDVRFAAILPEGDAPSPVIQASGTSALPSATAAGDAPGRYDHSGGDAD